MVKKKQFLHPKKESKKRKPAEPETANDFLEVGVDREEAGEKWRAGDAAKSLRFFLRAIETYNEGFQKFPEDFDLAYNKARLQYEITEQPRLLAHLPTPLNELLQIALDSHRYALTIDQDNADLLFNTAQVLTSLAETATEGKKPSEESRNQGQKLLQESLEFWQRCLTVQEYQLNQSEELETTPDRNEAESQQTNSPSQSPEEEETYATIVPPPTSSTLLDTLLAQIDTLTLLCTLSSPSQNTNSPLAWIQEYYSTSLSPKLTHFSNLATRQPEAHLATAKFQTALAEASYRSNLIDLPTYEREVNDSFSSIDLTYDPRGLCDKADAELSFSLVVRQNSSSPHDHPLLYHHASQALEAYTSATRLPNSLNSKDQLNLAQIHLRRGDCELLRWSISSASSKQKDGQEDGQEEEGGMDLDPPPAESIESKQTLLSNAALCYRMAGRAAASSSSSTITTSSGGAGTVTIGASEGDTKEEGKEAYVKGLVVGMLAGSATGEGWSEETWRDVREVVGELREESVLGREVEGLV